MHYHDVFHMKNKKVLYKKCIDLLGKLPAWSEVESTK